MWTCHNCKKPVYFAERRQSLGFDWHPYCLKCEECGKVLSPGQHAEHAGGPYCHIPCYAALFGPKLFGHGSTAGSHRSFGRRENSFVREQNETKRKLSVFNQYYADKPRGQVSSREVNGRLVLEGVLTIYWGTEGSIRLKEFDDNRLIVRHRKAKSLGFQFEDIQIVPHNLVKVTSEKVVETEGSDGEGGDDVGEGEEEEESDQEEDNVGKSEKEDHDNSVEDEIHSSSSHPFPGFNPVTHPLALNNSSLLQHSETQTNLESPDDLDLYEDLDLAVEGFLSYDPLHKWETLHSLFDEAGSPSSVSFPPFPPVLPLASPEPPLSLRPEPLQRSLSERLQGCREAKTVDSESKTLPSSLSNIHDDLDELLCVERKVSEHERIYHTVTGSLPVGHQVEDQGQLEKRDFKETQVEAAVRVLQELVANNIPPSESHVQESRGGKKFLVEKLPDDAKKSVGNSKPIFQLGSYQPRPPPRVLEKEVQAQRRSSLPVETSSRVVAEENKQEEEEVEEVVVRRGPRALRRRRKISRQAKLRRRSSINGHWYDRETAVFTPPKHSPMSVYTSSLAGHNEVLVALLSKYKVEADPKDYALYLINETGERRMLKEDECPLLVRVRTGPHEDISKLYLMDRRTTEEISHQVAEYIRFSYAELRSFLNMFYEEEEREADRIRAKYLVIRRRIQRQLNILERGRGHQEEYTSSA